MLYRNLVLNACMQTTTKRIGAALFDYAMIYGIMYVYIIALGEPNGQGGYTITGLPAFLPVLLWVLLLPGAETFFNRTLGKAIFGISVIGSGRYDPGFIQFLQRHLADVIDFALFGIPALLTVKRTEKQQRIGDLWAETRVVADEQVNCPGCGETVVLEGREVVSKSFTCPHCHVQVTPKKEFA